MSDHRISTAFLSLGFAAAASAQSALWTADGTFSGERFGLVVSDLGDVNGDGIADVLVGAPNSDLGAPDAGAVFVLSGADGAVLLSILRALGGDSLGFSAAGVGAPAGSATVFSGLDGSVIQRFEGIAGDDQFGDTAVGMGDANGDGFDDLFIGAFGFDGPAFGAGRTYAFSGFDTIGEAVCSPAVANTTGAAARLLARGSDAALDNDLTLTVIDLPANSNGFFVTSLHEFTVIGPGGSAGNICIASTVIGRYAGNILNSGASGTVSLDMDLTQIPLPTGTVATIAGDVRYWQYWYRDVPSSNFSDAVKISFQ